MQYFKKDMVRKMNKREWNEGLSELDPELVEKYAEEKARRQSGAGKKAKKLWLRAAAVAAVASCLALIVGAVFALPFLRGKKPPEPIETSETSDSGKASDSSRTTDPYEFSYTPISLDATVSPERISGSAIEYLVGNSFYGSGGNGEPPAFGFSCGGFNVLAKVTRNYPDIYYKLDVNSDLRPAAYRLVEMETTTVIYGQNLPQRFLYLIQDYLYVDMSVYDSLLISMEQIGTEHYVLRNAGQNRMEAFELPVFADREDTPQLGNIIAFTDGVFDESLWQNESWLYGYQFGRLYLDDPELAAYASMVVFRGDGVDDAIENIRTKFKDHYAYSEDYKGGTVLTLDFQTQAAKDAVEYVAPFQNGVFSQTLYPYGDGLLIFTRYINGCQTEETVSIDLNTEEVTYSFVRYTAEDLAQMENIATQLSILADAYEKQTPRPPHMDPEGKDLQSLHLFGWYVKQDEKLYGVIKTVWRYLEDHSREDYYVDYYDAAFLLFDMREQTASTVERDALLEIVGERNVPRWNLGEGYKRYAMYE